MAGLSPSADKLCRICKISRKDIRNHSIAKDCELRTKQNYESDIENLSGIAGDPSSGLKKNACLIKVFFSRSAPPCS